jgi:hypothetical protein
MTVLMGPGVEILGEVLIQLEMKALGTVTMDLRRGKQVHPTGEAGRLRLSNWH